MSIRSTAVGSFPKVTETGSDNLPGVIDRWQKKAVGEEALEQELQKVASRVIREQEEAGLDLVTDGQIRWEDLAHPLARSVRGLQRGTLRRFFDNNVYYRRLELPALSGVEGNGNLTWEKSSAAEEFAWASKIAKRPVKAVLPGPLTLVVSTEPKPGQAPEKLLSLYEGFLRQEVQALEKAGAQEIQLDEPALAEGAVLWKETLAAIDRIFQGVRARRWVASYFQDPLKALPLLVKLQQVEVLSVDLVSAREKVSGLLEKTADLLRKNPWAGEIALGLVDARNTKLEDPRELAEQARLFAQVVPASRLWISPNCGLEFLPHASVLKKLRVLKQAAETKISG